MKFLRNFLAAFLALVFFSGFIVLLVILSVMDDGLVAVKDSSVLHIKFNLPVTEREYENPFEGFPVNPGPPSSIGLIQFREALENAAEDQNIKGIFLDLDGLNAGFASVQELRNDLLDFRESGKFIVTYAKYYSEPAYYLASAADEIYMHPQGNVEFNGLVAGLLFFKGTFEKLEIEPEIFRVGDFKSAVEPLMRTDMSEENRMQLNQLIGSVNKEMIREISESRELQADSVQKMNDEYLVRSPEDALAYGLVDKLAYMDEMLENLSERSGKENAEDLSLITYGNYRQSYSQDYTSSNKIAMIVATGDIVGGEGSFEEIGSEKFTKAIRKAREDDKIKAIVLRINSPGGSFVASDALWREISLAAETKPVVASMGDAAASGGYYMAMACDTIVANPTTITGSIGIFSVLFNIKGFLNNKLGITTDGVTTGEFSDMYSSDRPVTDTERAIIQNELENNYETFISKAAAGRSMSKEAIREIASGRVWSGVSALEIGLVDVLGDSEDAVLIAAKMAGIEDDFRVSYSPAQESFLDMLFGGSQSQMRENAVREELGMMYPYIESLKKLERMQGIQARSLYELEIY